MVEVLICFYSVSSCMNLRSVGLYPLTTDKSDYEYTISCMTTMNIILKSNWCRISIQQRNDPNKSSVRWQERKRDGQSDTIIINTTTIDTTDTDTDTSTYSVTGFLMISIRYFAHMGDVAHLAVTGRKQQHVEDKESTINILALDLTFGHVWDCPPHPPLCVQVQLCTCPQKH